MDTPHLYGLVLAGGRSSRMGRDKGQIAYHAEVPHRRWLQILLETACQRAFLSLNAAQSGSDADGIVDDPAYETSPMGALLTAHAQHPQASWIVVSCDLAYFDTGCLRQLLDARDAGQAGTAFRIAELNQPEPLATIYEAAFVATLPAAYAAGERSLRRALHRAGAVLIDATETRCVESVDTPEAAAQALAYFRDLR